MQVFKTGFIEGHRWIFDADIKRLKKTCVQYGQQFIQTMNSRVDFYNKIYNTIYDVMQTYINSDIDLPENIRVSIIKNDSELQELLTYIYRYVCDYFDL